MNILLSNDDGIGAPGLRALAVALKKLGRVFVCAPEGPRSAASNAITLHKPVVAHETAPGWWSTSGTPADCVKLAILELLDFRPDIVVSGINNGLNSGANVLYSGTVAAALEGAQYGISSFAVSREFSEDEEFRSQAQFAVRLIKRLHRQYPRASTVFNVNLPAGRPRGIRVTVSADAPHQDRYSRRKDPRGRNYYWLLGDPARPPLRDGYTTDDGALARGYASVTPLRRDLTDPAMCEELGRLLHK